MRWIRVTAFPVIVFALSFYVRFLALTQTPFANGWDGYFYINQVRAFFEDGEMHVQDVSLIYGLLIGAQYFISDYLLSYKIVVSVIAAAYSLSLFLLAKKWSRDPGTPRVVAAFSVCSPHLIYFAAQYPKNLLGALFFLWLLYFVRSDTKWPSLVMFVVNFFGHRLTAVLSFIYLICFHLVQRARFKVIVIAGLTLLMISGVVSILPGVLNVFDVERLNGIFTTDVQFAPASFISAFGPELISFQWKAEIVFLIVIYVSAIILVARRYRKPDARLVSLTIILSILIFPFYYWSLDSPALRFVLMFLLLAPVLLILVADAWLQKNSLTGKYIAFAFGGLFFISSLWSFKSYVPMRHDPPYTVYSRIGEAINKSKPTRSYDLIIAHKSLAEYIVYSTHVDAMSWVPEYDVENEKLWRVVFGVPNVQWNFYLDKADQEHIQRITSLYCLIREDIWQRFIVNIRKDGNTELFDELNTWKNPSRKRPGFLHKN